MPAHSTGGYGWARARARGIVGARASMLARYAEVFMPSRAKDDPADAKLALDLFLPHPKRFNAAALSRDTCLDVSGGAAQASGADNIRFNNRLRGKPKQSCRQTPGWFGHIDTPIFCSFISRCPTLTQEKGPAGAPSGDSSMRTTCVLHMCRVHGWNQSRRPQHSPWRKPSLRPTDCRHWR